MMSLHGRLLPPLAILAASCLVSLAGAQRGPLGLNASDPYLITYKGTFTAPELDMLRTHYRLVVLEPRGAGVTRTNVETIQKGPDNTLGTSDDVMVLGYIAIGEDVPPGGVPRAGTEGPRKDPRTGITPKPSMASTVGPDGSPSLGLPSPNGGGQLLYERFYIDKDADGYPDFNPQFGGFFVNGGDPKWFDVLKNNTQVATTLCGFDEIMTTTVGKGLGMDGIFMDAIEVCAPDSYGTTMVEWTTPGFQSLVKKISDTYTSKIILQNRGPFFFDPRF